MGDMKGHRFIEIAGDLEHVGLIWQPEIGDEVAHRNQIEIVSILVDPQGMTPSELRAVFMWLPTVDQLVSQVEARQAILFHAGLELSGSDFGYKTVIQGREGHVESKAESLRSSLALALRDLILLSSEGEYH